MPWRSSSSRRNRGLAGDLVSTMRSRWARISPGQTILLVERAIIPARPAARRSPTSRPPNNASDITPSLVERGLYGPLLLFGTGLLTRSVVLTYLYKKLLLESLIRRI